MIVESVILSKTPQLDSSLSVHERHTDHTGASYDRIYMAPAGSDLAARLAENAAAIERELKLRDMQDAVFGPIDHVLTHATRDDLKQYVRDLYRNSDRDTLATVAMRVMEWVDMGAVTDDEAMVVTGMTAEQWSAAKAKMRTLVDAYKIINSAVGE